VSTWLSQDACSETTTNQLRISYALKFAEDAANESLKFFGSCDLFDHLISSFIAARLMLFNEGNDRKGKLSPWKTTIFNSRYGGLICSENAREHALVQPRPLTRTLQADAVFVP
jgi:hypothetical protein